MRWALRGRWLVGHVVVLLLAALFVRLGIWQLDRLDQRRDRNRVVETRLRNAAVDVADVPTDPDAARYRRVALSGTYDAVHQVVVRFRSNGGAPGSWLVTPLRLGDGRAVAVIRGWVPAGATPAVLRPPTGTVELRGIVDRPRLARPDPLAVTDVQTEVDERLYPWFVQLAAQTPPPADGLPDPLPTPDLDDGPHLSYAMQWFGFTAVGLVGWPLLLRREAQRHRRFSSPR
jgi:cytochrome oxidase assembly protein ShyY1